MGAAALFDLIAAGCMSLFKGWCGNQDMHETDNILPDTRKRA